MVQIYGHFGLNDFNIAIQSHFDFILLIFVSYFILNYFLNM